MKSSILVGIYQIKNIVNKVDLLKLGEFGETPEVDNTEPSL